MALPSSGQISTSQINTELGRASNSQISLDTAENGGYATINTNSSSRPNSANPAAMSEWYSYNHSASPPASCPAPTINSVTRCSTYAVLDISYSSCTNMEVEYSSNGGASWTTEGNTGCVTTKYIYNLSPSTTYLFRARVWCAATASWSPKSNVANTTTCVASGTLNYTYCSGNALYGNYADACCGSTNNLISSCHASCGCNCPAYGTYEGTYCNFLDCSSYIRYHDGNCGFYDVIQMSCDPGCLGCNCEGGTKGGKEE
jgi:hypothetical protein